MTKLTIGMPVFNNEFTLSCAIESLLDQSCGDFQVVISDDASTDQTESLCQGYARRDRRIRYVRQPRNLNYGNFRFVLGQADTPYFMWAAGDDWWAPDFIRANLEVLDRHDAIALSVSKAMFVRNGTAVRLSGGTYPLMGRVECNLARYLSMPSDNTRMYGIVRTGVAKQSFPELDFHAYDWAFSATTLLHGKHFEVSEVMMKRDYTPPSKYIDMIIKDSNKVIFRLFPLAALTKEIMFKKRVPRNWRILLALVNINLEKHFEYVSSYYPAYAKRLKPLVEKWRDHVAWRAHFGCP